MATYTELFSLQNNSDLINSTSVAVVVAADTIRLEDGATVNHANRLIWAKSVFNDPRRVAERMLWAILAQNKSSTVLQITGATDSTIQTAVDAAVDLFADGT